MNMENMWTLSRPSTPPAAQKDFFIGPQVAALNVSAATTYLSLQPGLRFPGVQVRGRP